MVAIDLDTLEVFQSVTNRTPLTSLTRKRRDTLYFPVRFIRNGVQVQLASGSTGIAGVKTPGDYSGDYLADALSWTLIGTGSSAEYWFELNLNTTQLNALFPDDNTASIPTILEITWTEDGRPLSMPVEIDLTIRNDYNQGGEGQAEDATPPWGSPDDYLKGSNNLSDVDDAPTAFTNIKQTASETATGVVELATAAEVNTAADALRAVTPATLGKGQANGVASLDGSGKILTAQLPSSVLDSLEYQGAWNASTNSPDITSAPETGWFYIVTTLGTSDPDSAGRTFRVGDWLVYNGTTWDHIASTEPAASETVAGLIELATQAEADAGSDTVRALTAATLAAWAGTWANSWIGNGAAYELPNQAADAAARVMTRALTDARHIRRAPVADPDDLTIVETLTGNQTLTAASEPIRYVTPDASGHTITLPEIAASPAGDQVAPGWRLKVVNEGLHPITIDNDSAVLELRLDPGETAQLIATATSWIVARAPENGVFEVRLLAQDLTAAGPVTLYTPQAGLEMLVHHAFVVLRTVDTVTVDATVKLTDATADLTSSLTLSTPAVGDAHEFAMSNPRKRATSSAALTLALPTPATATELVGDIYVYGSLIPAP